MARKGVNVPNAMLPLPPLTEKDRDDLEFAAALGVDWIAQSFVQRAEDVAEARRLVAGRAGLMVKIEKPTALKAIDAILEITDSVMVARGDLGVELPLEEVPGWQKRLTRAARLAGKPVVVATQMLESMIVEPVPTRAEVSDVATAVFEGADAIMLSAESASGAWPVKAVETMDRIAHAVENDPVYTELARGRRTEPTPTSADAIANAARTVAETIGASAIVCYTGSGSTGLRVARERPEVPIIALTPSVATGRRLSVVWGLHCVLTEDAAITRRHGFPRHPHRPGRGLRQAGGTRGHHRRRAVADARQDQSAAGCPDRLAGKRDGLDLLLGFRLDLLQRLLGAVKEGMDRQGAAESLQRLGLLPPIIQNGAEPGERPEMARLKLQHMGDVVQRAFIIAHQIEQGGALVPSLGELRLVIDDGVENAQRRAAIAGFHGPHRLDDQGIGGRTARAGPQFPDRVLDHLGRFLVLGFMELTEQPIQELARQSLVGRRRPSGFLLAGGRWFGKGRRRGLSPSGGERQDESKNGGRNRPSGLLHALKIGMRSGRGKAAVAVFQPPARSRSREAVSPAVPCSGEFAC